MKLLAILALLYSMRSGIALKSDYGIVFKMNGKGNLSITYPDGVEDVYTTPFFGIHELRATRARTLSALQ